MHPPPRTPAATPYTHIRPCWPPTTLPPTHHAPPAGKDYSSARLRPERRTKVALCGTQRGPSPDPVYGTPGVRGPGRPCTARSGRTTSPQSDGRSAPQQRPGSVASSLCESTTVAHLDRATSPPITLLRGPPSTLLRGPPLAPTASVRLRETGQCPNKHFDNFYHKRIALGALYFFNVVVSGV